MNYNVNQYDFLTSIKLYIEDKLGLPCDIVTDGYKWREDKPFCTIEQSSGNISYNVKGREAVESIYRAQIGLHASNGVERMRLQERVNDALMFGNIPYYDFNKSAEVPVGFFSVEIENVMPMPADDIAKQSKRHTVYFDVEILTIKRGC